MLDVHFDDQIVHFVIAGVANGSSGEPFERSPKIPVEPFDMGSVRFVYLVLCLREGLRIGFVIIGEKSTYREAFSFWNRARQAP